MRPVTFRWRYLDAAGAPTSGPSEEFVDRNEAESWFGDVWADLRATGVDAVTLLDAGAEVYGPMSLQDP